MMYTVVSSLLIDPKIILFKVGGQSLIYSIAYAS